jgi:hypothetical protein
MNTVVLRDLFVMMVLSLSAFLFLLVLPYVPGSLLGVLIGTCFPPFIFYLLIKDYRGPSRF